MVGTKQSSRWEAHYQKEKESQSAKVSSRAGKQPTTMSLRDMSLRGADGRVGLRIPCEARTLAPHAHLSWRTVPGSAGVETKATKQSPHSRGDCFVVSLLAMTLGEIVS